MLLQRGNFTINNIEEINKLETKEDGLKSVIDLDYMGEVEFEGNTIPLSRMIIEYNSSKYLFYYIDIFNNNGEQMIVYANSERASNITDWHEFGLKLINKNYTLYKHVHISGNESTNNFWWDVNADYFVFFGEEKKELINYFINGCYKRDGGKELIKQKIEKCGFRID